MTLDQFWSAVYAGMTIRAFPPFRFLLTEASFDALAREIAATPGLRQSVVSGESVTMLGAHRIERHSGTADVVVLCDTRGEVAQVHDARTLAAKGSRQEQWHRRVRACAIGEGAG